MPIRQYKYVFIMRLHRELGIVLHDLEVQSSKELRTSQRTPWVAACGPMYHSYDISPDLSSNVF